MFMGKTRGPTPMANPMARWPSGLLSCAGRMIPSLDEISGLTFMGAIRIIIPEQYVRQKSEESMSTVKLTLSVEPEIVREAKESAAALHTSVSALFARLLRAMTATREVSLDSSPVTRQATGIVTLPSDVEDSELLADALESKYGVGT